MNWNRINTVAIIALILFLFGEIVILFFTPRTETLQLFVVYFALCGAYFALYHEVKSIQIAAFLGVLFRGISWLAFPELSDDIYRFIWDGSVTLEGISPYALIPTDFLADHVEEPFEQLYPLLNSTGYYSVYPTIIQLVSAFGALAANDPYQAALIIKLPLFLAEIGTIWMLPKVLLNFKLSPKYSVLYFLNPLIIIDALGNAHFELLVVFFLVAAFRLIQDRKLFESGIMFGLAISTKLIPILLIPFFLKVMKTVSLRKFLLGSMGTTLILGIPLLYKGYYLNLFESIQLYYQTFEFNASFYFLFSRTLEWIIGYNPIGFLGPALGVLTLIGLAIILIRQERLMHGALHSSMVFLTMYMLLATTVHPWYIATILLLGLFNRVQYPVIWSVVVILSYGAYSTIESSHNYWLVLIEYAILLVVVAYPKRTRRLFRSTLGLLNP